MHVFLYCLQALKRSDNEKTRAHQGTVKSSPGPKSDRHKDPLMQPPQISERCRPDVTMQQSTATKVAVAQALPQSKVQKGTVVGGLL